MLLAALVSLYPAVCRAQACPIEIEGASQQDLNSEMGAYGTALKMTYRNASPFPVHGIEFGIQAIGANNSVSRPGRIIANHQLAPNGVDSLLWNATRFDKQNAAKTIYIVWAALVFMEDGSKLGNSAAQCGYRTDQGKQSGAHATSSGVTTAASDQGNSAQQFKNLIDNGTASLVNVTSDPSGANVDVDEKLIGRTPLSFVLMRASNGAPRSILVYKLGYTLAGRDVLPNGKTINLNEKLTALTNR